MIKKILHKLQLMFAPTAHQKELQRWFKDQGDSKLKFQYPLNPESLVFDVGGFKGQWAWDMNKKFGSRIFVFEPVPVFAEQIRQKFEGNNAITVFPFALGENDRSEYISLAEEGSSVFIETAEKTEIHFRDVNDFFKESCISHINLMKLNIEGGEYELLPALIRGGFIEQIDNIQIQFHNLFPGAEKKMMAIQKELEYTHFLTYQYKFVWENWQRRTNS